MRKKLFFILFFCLLLLYIVFSPRDLKKELVFLSSWGIDTQDTAADIKSENAVPFDFDSVLGYFSPAGQMLYSEDVDFSAAISEDLFINYSGISDKLVLRKPDGDFMAAIETEGFPFFIHKRLFVISPDRMIVTEYDYNGVPLLSLSPGSAVISMDAAPGTGPLILGTLDGRVVIYTDTPEPDFTYFSTDSRYSITYACALSEDGNRFAAVTGLYPQQLVCFEYRAGEYVPVFRMNMRDTFRRNLLLDYSNDGKLLYMENSNGIDVYSTATFLRQEVGIEGSVIKTVFPGEKSMSFILSAGEENNFLRIYRSDIGRIADFCFPSGDIYFYPAKNCFYIGMHGRIFRYDIIEG